MGYVSTGAAGTDATVINSGTSSAAVFDFVIPRGEDGTGTVASVNGQTGTVVLTATDVGALPTSTTIGDGAVIFQKNGAAFNTITANQTSTTTINYTIPTTASDIGALPDTTTIGAGSTTIQVNGTVAGTINANQTSDNTINIVAGGGLPSQTGNSGKVLTTDGTDASWGATSTIYPVIETYISGTSGYRIWAADSTSYRYCEQWGYKATVSTANTLEKVELLKTYTDTNYQAIATVAGTNGTSYTVKVGSASQNETDGFYIAMSNVSAGAWWRTFGYIVDEV